MKKISILLLSTVIALCMFNSCSSDDDEKLEGKWSMVRLQYNVDTGDEDLDKLIISRIEGDGYFDVNEVIEFKSNGEVWFDGKYYEEKYRIEKAKIIIYDLEYDDEYIELDYSLNGNNLILVEDIKEDLIERWGDDFPNVKLEKANIAYQFIRVK